MAGLLRTLAALWLLRQAYRLLRIIACAAILAALWPVTMAPAAAAAAAWSLGWPPAQLYRAAARSSPVVGVWAVAAALRYRAWQAVALGPVRDWQQATGLLAHGRVLPAVLLTAPLGVPAPTADGGVWVMQTPYPEPLSELAGTRRVLESARKLLGATWGDEGSTRVQHAWTADPDLIRRPATGQACYIQRGTATFA